MRRAAVIGAGAACCVMTARSPVPAMPRVFLGVPISRVLAKIETP
ncbi:MAG: hypothetical protein ACRYHQ_29540 [Janthinobacterium lividum]